MLERLDEVEVLDPALGAGDCLAVVREEVSSLLRVNYKVTTGCALSDKVELENKEK